ncbi:Bug family tripartite tricarboxylate transporter substrate binding protein [Humitalea sp. 24SJ18S-53]|uniref:Bug family tripartite tricarboxylate transporter substrate binding protein n=1 Tax=Humitalea sp. 24SJ18S-53 TaxID=3422307 RepID=UPI003D665006
MPTRRHLIGAAGLMAVAARASAQGSYPTRPVRLVVGAPPGGGNDIVARLLAERLGRHFGQNFVVDNRPGASGARAAEWVTQQPADGHVLLLANVATHAINAVLVKDSTFDADRDSVPVAPIGTSTNILVVTPSLPVQSVAELIAYARANPGKLNYGSAGSGGSVHLAGELFKLRTGVDIVHVPYRGAGPMVTDLMAGTVQLAFDNYPSSIGAVRGGALRALAVTSGERWPLAPELPTMIESGVPDFTVTTWFGVTARSGTPDPILAALWSAIDGMLAQADFQQALAAIGAVPMPMGRVDFGRFMTGEQQRWRDIVTAARVTLND